MALTFHHIVFVAVLLSHATPLFAQNDAAAVRRSPTRRSLGCGGDRVDGVCGTTLAGAFCSADPSASHYDADCFSADFFDSPEPEAACEPKSEPCEIHEAINRMGWLFESQAYNNDVMESVILSYWDSAYWDLPDRWGAHGLDGYVVFAVVRNALRYHEEMRSYPTTVKALEYLLRDHASRGLPTTVDNGERWFHGGEKYWNTWSEDYMAFALGYAAADAWFASPWFEGAYYDEYREMVTSAVDLAFSISHNKPQTLRFEFDADPALPADTKHVMLRNHGEYSPVYAMAIIARLWDINVVYRAAGLPDAYNCDNKPENFDALFAWMALKIEPNSAGGGYVFREDGCERHDGEISFCDDRPGDGTPGDQREPAHYPLDQILPNLCVTEHVEYFGPACKTTGPAGTTQTSFNFYFNCAFQEVEGDVRADAPEPLTP